MQTAPDRVLFSAAPHPLKAANTQLELPEGLTIKEMIDAAQPDPVLLGMGYHVEIDGVPVDPSKIHVIRPKAGHLVTVRVAPGKSAGKALGGGGGKKNPLATVLSIVVVAAAITAMVLVPGLAGVALATGISLAGGLAISMAFPPSPLKGNFRPGGGAQSVEDMRDSPSQFIEGARNSATPWAVVPDVLGKHRMVPPYAGLPYTWPTGSDQYLHMMFAWSPGHLSIDNYRIGETPLSDFDGVELRTLFGDPLTDDPSTFNGVYSSDVSEEPFSILLTQTVGYQRRTTAPDAVYIMIDLTLPQGLVKFDNFGKRQPHAVVLNVRYRVVGGTFGAPPVLGATFPAGNMEVEGDHLKVTLVGMTTSAVRHGIAWFTPFVGQFEVEVARASVDNTSSQMFDQVGWTALRRGAPTPPLNFPVPLARTALRIKASDQLNNVIDTFSAVVHRVAPDFDGVNWVNRATSNPAAMFRHVLQGPSNRRPVPDSEIDLPKLQQWSEFCRLSGFECNMIVDFPTNVKELLQVICGTGRASLDNRDGKWSVVIDEPKMFPVQHFTPRNSKGFRAIKAFPDKAHAWRVRFNDREHDWRSAERIVYAPGFDAATATKFEQHDFAGVTNAPQAIHLATHQMRSVDLQPEEWDLEVDFEHLVANRGDLVVVTHDVLLVGIASGRIKALDLGGGGEIIGMTSDEALPMTFAAGTEYGVSVRTVPDAQRTTEVTRLGGQTEHELTFDQPLPAGTISVGDLFGFGLLGRETVRGQVKRIKRGGDLTARVTLLPYTDALWNWAMPADFDPGMTPLQTVAAPNISSVYTGGAALGREPDATLVRVVIECVALNRANSYLEARGRPAATGENYRALEVVSRPEPNIIVLGGMRVGETWDLRVRWVVGALQPGPWAYRSGVLIEGAPTEATTLDNLTLSAFGGQAHLRWDPPDELDARFGGVVHFRHSTLQVGATWAASTSIGQGVPARNQTATLPLKGGTYLARIFDSAGRPGAIATVSTKQHSVHQFNLLVSFDEHPDWAGPKNGTEVVAGALQLDGTFRPGVGGFGNLGDVAVNGYYDFLNVVDLEAVRRVRVTVHMVAASVNVDDLIDSRLDLIDNWQDFDGTDDQAEADAQVWVRITDDDPGMATSEWAWIDDTNWSDGTGWTDADPSGVDWKLHQRLDSAEFEARGFDFQLRMASKDPGFNIVVSELTVNFQEVV